MADEGCEPFLGSKRSDDDLCSVEYIRNHSHLSDSSTMSRICIPNFVYRRKKQHTNSIAYVYQRKRHHTDSIVIPPNHQPASNNPTDGCNSVIISEGLSLIASQHVISVSDHPTEVANSLSIGQVRYGNVTNGFYAGGEDSEDTQITNMDRVLTVFSANDNCSSSRSNLGHDSPSLKVYADDAGDCSSSGALVVEESPKEIYERDICISILRSRGLLDKIYRASTRETEVSLDNYCSKSCKVCQRRDSTRNMLICDICGDAFHCSCCNPCVKILPAGEWLCRSCLKKKHKILTDTFIGSSANRHPASDTELGSLEVMFQDNEPYMSNVRIGDEFQANISEWRGPDYEASDLPGEPLEMDPSININMPEGGVTTADKRFLHSYIRRPKPTSSTNKRFLHRYSRRPRPTSSAGKRFLHLFSRRTKPMNSTG